MDLRRSNHIYVPRPCPSPIVQTRYVTMMNTTTVAVRRDPPQLLKDFLTFPLRALTLFEDDKWGLSALRSERFDYVAREVRGYCLDVGCGRHNWFITHYLGGNGVGIDVFAYEGLSSAHLVEDITQFPFE